MSFIDACLSWPTLPATILTGFAFIYWIMVLIGALDIELFDVDLDFDADDSLLSAGFLPLKFLNIGSVPLMLWLSAFGISAWTFSMLVDHHFWPRVWADASTSETAKAVARTVAFGIVFAKLATNPLRGMFDVKEPNLLEDLIGRECVITTVEATEQSGQAQLAAEAAPLLLNVRTLDGSLNKGDKAKIVEFDPDKRIYLVRSATEEV